MTETPRITPDEVPGRGRARSPRGARAGLSRAILRGVLWVVAHPVATLALAGVVLGVCVLGAALTLRISTDQNKQFSPNATVFREYLDFIERFPENEAIYVVVEARDAARPPPVAAWAGIADAIAARVVGLTKYVRSVDHRVAASEMGRQGLAFDSEARMRAAHEDAKRFVPLAKLWGEAPSGAAGLLGQTGYERFLGAVTLAPPDIRTAAFVTLLADSWKRALESDRPLTVGDGLPDLASLDAADPSRLGYYYVPDASDPTRWILLVRVYPSRDFGSMTALSDALAAIRAEVAAANAAFPEFRTGITGRPALEGDELRTTNVDARTAEILALSAIFIGLVVLLRSVWLAIVTEIGLGVGIGWTFGWATVSVGELNLLSMVFLLALIGIGVDYLIQVASAYQREALRGRRGRALWVGVFRSISAPINTTCAGAAGAFLVSVFTDFKGAAELGIIAGGGLFLCLVAGYTVMPAVLTLAPARVRARQAPRSGGRFTVRHPWLAPAAWCLLVLAGVPFAMRARFDPGLISLQAPNLESVQLVRRLNTWSAVVLSKDLDVLRRSREAVVGLPGVLRTESILDAMDNRAWLSQPHNELPGIDWVAPPPVRESGIGAIARRATALAARFLGLAQDAGPEAAHVYEGAASALTEFAKMLSTDSASAPVKLSEWQRGFVNELRENLGQFTPPKIDVDALPAQLRTHFRSDDDTYALYIHPRRDLWEQQHLAEFVSQIDAALAGVPGAPRATGIAPNIYHTTAGVRSAFYTSTGLALGFIFLLVVLDFRRLTPTLLAFSVLALGLPMLVAVMGLLNISWNFANFFGLPILIGAGHEYGVFLVHRAMEARRDPRRAWGGGSGSWDASDRALLLCAFATCASFGFFWAVGHHQGLRSLGLVMALGVLCIYLASLIALRPLLMWWAARPGPSPDGPRRRIPRPD